MKLIIFATKKDLSAPIIVEEAKKCRQLQAQIAFYEDSKLENGKLKVKNKALVICPEDRLLIRWPWDADNTEIEYNGIVKHLTENFYNQIVLDKKCLRDNAEKYEDKYFQSRVFADWGIPTPKTWLVENAQELNKISLSFPAVVKKRISSRSKGNYLVNSNNEILEKTYEAGLANYVLQEKIDVEYDLRVLMLRGAILGVVSRYMHLRDEGRLAVKGMEIVTKLDEKIEADCRKIINGLGADLVGFDVLIDKRKNYFFIEANLSPQFNSFMQTTGINVAREIVECVN